MALVDAVGIERYLGVSRDDATRIARWLRPAMGYLRDLKGGLWYDAMRSALPIAAPPGEGTDGAAPTIEVHGPIPDEECQVSSTVLVRLTLADDIAVTRAEYAYKADGVTGGDPAYADFVPMPVDGLPSSEVEVAFLLDVPAGRAWLFFRAGDAVGNVTDEVIEINVPGDDLAVFDVEAVTFLPSPEERQAAEHAEALLALYYGLPQLNLRLDPEGGVLSTVWTTDEASGARTQTQFAGSDRLDALRSDLLQQAKLLVMGGVRIAYDEGAASTLIDGVEGYGTSGGGYFGYI